MKEATWFVYIIENEKGFLYCGITTDLERRFKEHSTSPKGAKFFRSGAPVEIVFQKKFPNRSLASKFEAAVKKLTRTQRQSKFAKDAGVRGGGGLSSFGGVMGTFGILPPNRKTISYGGSIAPEKDPAGISQQRINFSTPVWNHKNESFSFSTGAGLISFSDTRNFRNTTIKTPVELKRVEIGGQYNRRLKDKRAMGFRASVGSASDKILYGMEEMTFSVNGFYAFPDKDNDADHWILSVFLSNNNSLANYIPIPGFIYLHKTENFTGMFGLPFLSMQWTPVKPVILSMSYFITNLNTEAAYGFTDHVQAFTGFSISQQTFLRKDRENLTDRLFYNEKKLFVGFRSPLSQFLSGDVQFGQVFDRRLQEGKRFNDAKYRADFGRSWFASLNVNMAFQ